jgi:hypothetical protein
VGYSSRMKKKNTKQQSHKSQRNTNDIKLYSQKKWQKDFHPPMKKTWGSNSSQTHQQI